MNAAQTLRITRAIKISHGKSWLAIGTTLVIFTVGPLLALLQFQVASTHQYGDITRKLIYDVRAAFPRPKPFRGAWLEHSLVVNGSSYESSPTLNDLNSMEMAILLFPWGTFNMLCFSLFLFGSRTGNYICLNNILKISVHKLRILMFLIICTAHGFLIVLAVDGAINASYYVINDKIIRWLDSSIVKVGSEEMGMGLYMEQDKHPFTLGQSNPYFIQKHYRYAGEDVQFICEYKVLGEENTKPIFGSSWWNKNGLPVEVDDRMFVNVTIQAEDGPSFIALQRDMRYYTIRNTLTIHLIENRHYGRYTCHYYDPLPLRTKVEPVFQQFRHPSFSTQQPMSPAPNCDCKPTQNRPRSQRRPSSQNSQRCNSFVPQKIPECFAEFELRSRMPPQPALAVDVNVGGIISEFFNYATLADLSDISVDVTFLESTSAECCSVFTKMYWIFVKGGLFVDLPLSRVGLLNDSLTTLEFSKWMCICRQSLGVYNNMIYRDIFNTTLGSRETIDIAHPVSLILQAYKNETSTFLHTLHFCDESSPPYTLCGFLDFLLQNRLYTVYGVDVVILVLFLLYAFLFHQIVRCLRTYVIVPSRKSCQNLCSRLPIHFEAVNGPPVNKVCHNRNIPTCENSRGQSFQGYDVYLSYCHEDHFDRAVAQHLKHFLFAAHLTVFDPNEDILGGRPVLTETHSAIHTSSRFVIVASKAYNEDFLKQVEFDSVNDTIKSQMSSAKSRLLIVRVGVCHVDGLHRVPCIPIHDTMRDNFQLDPVHENRFKEWELATRPEDRGRSCTPGLYAQLRQQGFCWKSLLYMTALVVLASYSTWFEADGVDCDDESCYTSTDVDLL